MNFSYVCNAYRIANFLTTAVLVHRTWQTVTFLTHHLRGSVEYYPGVPRELGFKKSADGVR